MKYCRLQENGQCNNICARAGIADWKERSVTEMWEEGNLLRSDLAEPYLERDGGTHGELVETT